MHNHRHPFEPIYLLTCLVSIAGAFLLKDIGLSDRLVALAALASAAAFGSIWLWNNRQDSQGHRYFIGLSLIGLVLIPLVLIAPDEVASFLVRVSGFNRTQIILVCVAMWLGLVIFFPRPDYGGRRWFHFNGAHR